MFEKDDVLEVWDSGHLGKEEELLEGNRRRGHYQVGEGIPVHFISSKALAMLVRDTGSEKAGVSSPALEARSTAEYVRLACIVAICLIANCPRMEGGGIVRLTTAFGNAHDIRDKWDFTRSVPHSAEL